MSELRGLGAIHDELKRSRGKLYAVSVDASSVSAGVVHRYNLDYPILSDADRRVIADYGLVHTGGGPDGKDIAIPTHFLIDRDGRILWRRIACRIQDRPDPKVVTETIRKLLTH